MKILKFLLRLILFPLLLPVILLQWVLTFLTAFSEIVFYLLAGAIFFTALFGAIFGLFSLSDGLKMLVPSFILWMVPNVSEWLIYRIIDLRTAMNNIIRS